MSAHSSSSSGPALLMSSFGTRIFPTSWSSAASSTRRCARASRPSRSRDRQRERDDVAAVAARVGVVGLDHVPEEEGGAPVGGRELERGVDARHALAREHESRPRSGRRSTIAPLTSTAAMAARRPTGVSATSTAHARAMYGSCARGEIPRTSRSQPAALAKSKTICAARAGRSTSSAASPGSGCPSGGDHEGRADGVPRVDEVDEGALGVEAPVVDEAPEDEPGGDGERHEARREHEQHRDEDELRRDGPARGDLERDARGEGVREDERCELPRRRRVTGRNEGRHRDRDDEEGRPEGDRRPEPTAAESRGAARARLLDQLGDGRVDVGGRRGHEQRIGVSGGRGFPRRRDRAANALRFTPKGDSDARRPTFTEATAVESGRVVR